MSAFTIHETFAIGSLNGGFVIARKKARNFERKFSCWSASEMKSNAKIAESTNTQNECSFHKHQVLQFKEIQKLKTLSSLNSIKMLLLLLLLLSVFKKRKIKKKHSSESVKLVHCLTARWRRDQQRRSFSFLLTWIFRIIIMIVDIILQALWFEHLDLLRIILVLSTKVMAECAFLYIGKWWIIERYVLGRAGVSGDFGSQPKVTSTYAIRLAR